jgi:hypothetical protein
MYIPKQSIPVLRNLNSVSVSNYRGVSASTIGETLNRLLNRPGTCACRQTNHPVRYGQDWYDSIIPKTNHCNSGFAPQCDTNAGCQCVDSRQVTNGGRVSIPVSTPGYVQFFDNFLGSGSDSD